MWSAVHGVSGQGVVADLRCHGSSQASLVDSDFDVAEEAPRWNTWTILQPVQFEGEERPRPRTLRLCCAALPVGDRIQVTDGRRTAEGQIVRSRIRSYTFVGALRCGLLG